MQVGFVGLVKAIDRFDTGYNVMFSTYAVPMIMGEIKRYIRDDGKIKIGRQMKTEMKNLKKLQQEYYHKHGVSPRVSWLADKMEISREHVLEILEAIAKVRGCLKKGEELDYGKASGILFDDFRSGKLGRITVEWPPVKEEKA